MIEKILEMLEELEEEFASEAEDDYFLGAYRGVVKSKEIVQEVAKEYDALFDVIYKKVCELEGEYAESGDIENVNRCIRLENLLQYLKEELIAPYQKGE